MEKRKKAVNSIYFLFCSVATAHNSAVATGSKLENLYTQRMSLHNFTPYNVYLLWIFNAKIRVFVSGRQISVAIVATLLAIRTKVIRKGRAKRREDEWLKDIFINFNFHSYFTLYSRWMLKQLTLSRTVHHSLYYIYIFALCCYTSFHLISILSASGFFYISSFYPPVLSAKWKTLIWKEIRN